MRDLIRRARAVPRFWDWIMMLAIQGRRCP